MARIEKVLQDALIEAELFDTLVESALRWGEVIVRFEDGVELEAWTDRNVLVFAKALDDERIRDLVSGGVKIIPKGSGRNEH